MHIDSSSLIVTVNGVLWSTRCAANRSMISHSFSAVKVVPIGKFIVKNQKWRFCFCF